MRYQSATIRRAPKWGWVLSMAVFVGLLVALYSIKAHTLAAKIRVTALEQILISERQVVQMLSAEIAHLESPERLRILADQQLGLQPTPVSRTMSLAEATQAIVKKPQVVTKYKSDGEQ